jgi:hypothetical protein
METDVAERAKATAKSKKQKAPKGAQGSRGKVAKTETAAGVGHNSGEPSADLVADHHTALLGLEAEVAKDKAKYDRSKQKLRARYATCKKDGIDVDAFKMARELHAADHGVVIQTHANVGVYLAAIGSELSEVEGLFTDIKVLDAMNASIAGRAAFDNKEPRDNNPHKPGTEAHVKWDGSWVAASQKATLVDAEGAPIN